jgi:hypothetical protein
MAADHDPPWLDAGAAGDIYRDPPRLVFGEQRKFI